MNEEENEIGIYVEDNSISTSQPISSQELDFSKYWRSVRDSLGESPEKPKPDRPKIPFQKFTYSELKKATENFKESFLLSEDGSYGDNLVFRGQLPSGLLVAVKKYRKGIWKDLVKFEELVYKVASFDHESFVPLIGFCSDNEHRILVAEYLPLDTLDKHLLHWEKQPMTWDQRLSVAIKVANVLKSLEKEEDMPFYVDLNPYRVLFDKDDLPRLSCFGLLKPPFEEANPEIDENEHFSSTMLQLPPEFAESFAGITSCTVVWCYGSLLVSILSGKNLRPNQFLEFVRTGRAHLLVDSSFALHRKFSDALIPLTNKCLNEDPTLRPSLAAIVAFLENLEAKINGIKQNVFYKESRQRTETQLSETAEAIASQNMDVIFQILLTETNQYSKKKMISLAYLKPGVKQSLSAKERGDKAFENSNWPISIVEYKMVLKQRTSTVDLSYLMLRVSFAYLHLGDARSALAIANDAIRTRPDFYLAYYMYALALRFLGRYDDYRRALDKATFAEKAF